MARPKRIDLPFCLYHVTSRTGSGDAAFKDRHDRGKFLEYLAKYGELFQFRIHAYCLLPNHFHLLLESSRKPELSQLMQRLLTSYTMYYNNRHNHSGNIFQGRFKSQAVEKSHYLLELSRYVHLHPARLKRAKDPFLYKSSSLPFYVQGSAPDFLYTKEILLPFKGNGKRYARFVKKGLDCDDRPEVSQQRYIGGKAFVRRMNKRLDMLDKPDSPAQKSDMKNREKIHKQEKKQAERIIRIVAKHYEISPEAIKTGYQAHGEIGQARTIAIRLLREELPWTRNEIGNILGIKKELYNYMKRAVEDTHLKRAYKTIKKNLKTVD